MEIDTIYHRKMDQRTSGHVFTEKNICTLERYNHKAMIGFNTFTDQYRELEQRGSSAQHPHRTIERSDRKRESPGTAQGQADDGINRAGRIVGIDPRVCAERIGVHHIQRQR